MSSFLLALIVALSCLEASGEWSFPTARTHGMSRMLESVEGANEGVQQEFGTVDNASLVGAVMLVSSLIFAMVLFYMVNSSRAQIRRSTWSMISMALSIFLAVMWYQAVGESLDEAIGPAETGRQPHVRLIVASLHWLLVCITFLTLTVCFSSRFGFSTVTAVSVLGAHLGAFSSKDVFNTLIHMEPFSETVALACSSVFIAVFCATLWCLLGDTLFIRVARRVFDKDRVDKLVGVVSDAENDMFCLCISFLITQVIRFAILGELPPAKMESVGHTEEAANILLGVSLVLLLVKFPVAWGRAHKLFRRVPPRMLACLETSHLMTVAWCWLYWGDWVIVDTSTFTHALLAKVCLAVTFSLLAVLAICTIDGIVVFGTACDLDMYRPGLVKLYDDIVLCVSLLVAFSWEQCFDMALEDIEKGTVMKATSLKVSMAVLLWVFFLPAWAMYILPRALAAEAAELAEEVAHSGKGSKDKHDCRSDAPSPVAATFSEQNVQNDTEFECSL